MNSSPVMVWLVLGSRTFILVFLMLAEVARLLSHTVTPSDTNQGRQPVTWEEISGLPAPPAGQRIAYGSDPLNFGDLRLPTGPGPHPLVVVVHGGCWRAENDLRHISHLSAALTRAGTATWTIEYRRVGNEGGGWPGTFHDVSRAADHVRELARRFPLDLDRVILIGHSAGGQLALWLAARRNLRPQSPVFSADPIRVRGVVSLAGITDLRGFSVGSAYCNPSVVPLLGGAPDAVPERYAQTSPVELLPLRVPVRLLQGSLDTIVPSEQSTRFATRASSGGDDAKVLSIEGAGHFDLIAPFAPAWAHVQRAVVSLISAR